ncbi:MAG: response regulator [Elusimicrobiota bacterium]|nr:MAG: response regulator [Elusimicrobiota bacterium]
MSAIGLLAKENEDREHLATMLGELGHRVEGAARLEEALETARERRPRAFLLVDGPACDAETMTRELLRAFPLLPVVVALKTRDARRAVELMRAGAAEVVAPPWTPEDLKACVAKGLRFQGTSISISGAAPLSRSPVWFALAAAVFLAAGLGVASKRRVDEAARAAAARVDQWQLPVRHPAGLAFDGKAVWLVEWFTQSFYALDTGDPSIKIVRHLTAETPVAAAFTGEAVWTVSADGGVTRRMRDERLTPLARYPRAAPSSAGLAFDGLYLWTLDARAKVLRKHLVDRELSVLAVYKWRGTKPAGIVFDGKTLWTLDAGDRRLLRHSLERPEDPIDSLPLPEYAAGDRVPSGLAWDGTRFWTVAASRDERSPATLIRHAEEPPR